MSDIAQDMAEFLVANGIGARGGDADWGVHVSREPVKPVNVVTVVNTGGAEPDTDDMDRQPTFLIRVRSKDYDTGWEKINDAFRLLIENDPIEVGSNEYLVWATTDILPIGRDDGDRHLFTANFRSRKEGV